MARFAPDPPSDVPKLLRHLSHDDDDVRTAAAEGLLWLGAEAESAAAELEKVATHRDMRLRWRAAAWLVLTGRKAAVQIGDDLARAIDGPEDLDRIAAFQALVLLGPKAASLATRLEPWAEYPVPASSHPAKLALDAVRGTGTAPARVD
jgi:HEAT repeat protein